MPFLYTKNIISNKDKFITFKIKNFKRKKKIMAFNDCPT